MMSGMERLFLPFNIDVPFFVVLTSSLLALLCAVVACLVRGKMELVFFARALIMEYVFIILCVTLICRSPLDEYRLELMPFWSIRPIMDGTIFTIQEKIFNILLFMPLGIFVAVRICLESAVLSGRVWMFWRVVGFGALVSISIELLQLITKRGTCETDDVICNTIGYFVGYEIVMLCWRGVVLKRIKGRKTINRL